jgi:hypothetical protein
VNLRKWTPRRAGTTLRGFAEIELPSGMILSDVAVHVASNGRAWASPPSRPQIDRDGQHMVGKEGKKLYQPIITFRDRDIGDRFSRAVLDAVAAAHPHELEGWRP